MLILQNVELIELYVDEETSLQVSKLILFLYLLAFAVNVNVLLIFTYRIVYE